MSSASEPASQVVFVDGRVYHLGLRAEELHRHLFLVGDPARAHLVASRFERVDHEVRHREFVTLSGAHRGLPVSVIGTGIGPDNLEIALVEAWALLALDPATGRRRPLGRGPGQSPPPVAIRIGTSGGLREELPVGTLVVSSYAVGLDGTGLFYELPPADATVTALERAAREALDAGVRPGSRFAGAFRPYASRATPSGVAAREAAPPALGIAVVTGGTVTSPGFFGPSGRRLDGVANTVARVKERLGAIESDGVRLCNMEMESSLLFHLGAALGFETGTICATLSNPSGHGQIPDPSAAVANAIDVALEAMQRHRAGG